MTSNHSTPLHSTPNCLTPLCTTLLHSTPFPSSSHSFSPLYIMSLHFTPLHSTPTPFHSTSSTFLQFTPLYQRISSDFNHFTSPHINLILYYLTSSHTTLHHFTPPHFYSLQLTRPHTTSVDSLYIVTLTASRQFILPLHFVVKV